MTSARWRRPHCMALLALVLMALTWQLLMSSSRTSFSPMAEKTSVDTSLPKEFTPPSVNSAPPSPQSSPSDKKRTAVFVIANELFFSVAASLADRKPDKRDYYLDWAHRSRDWFENSGLVNAQGVVNDGLNLTTCENDGDTVWSYNQGVILGAYVELAKADYSASYLTDATSIARAAITNLSDSNQILHDVCEPRCDNTAAQFKGVFMRNLRILQQASPRAEFATFINKNADGIWANDRTTSDSETLLGQVWSGPFIVPANATTQSSALDALVAAAAIAL